MSLLTVVISLFENATFYIKADLIICSKNLGNRQLTYTASCRVSSSAPEEANVALCLVTLHSEEDHNRRVVLGLSHRP